MSFSNSDIELMSRAIKLARKGTYTTTPNPNVGCVIADENDNIIGEGWHQRAGTPHAEVHALQMAGTEAKGATAYVTLEPCSHTGRTPPCADALIAAGVSRVVAAMQDPNPMVAGRGLARLVDAGIRVQSGLLASEAEALNRGFLHRMRSGRPLITVKLASSLDGKTALHNGVSKWITGPEARRDVQRHRAASCAILSGAGTVLADNPSLNVRYAELGHAQQAINETNLRQPARVILDGKNQLADELNVWNDDTRVICVNSQNNPRLPPHVTQWQAPLVGGKIDLTKLMNFLGKQQFNHVWVEAGGKLAGALIKEKLVDELILYQAPKLLGHAGLGLVDFAPIDSMDEAIALTWRDIRQVGHDLKLTADVLY